MRRPDQSGLVMEAVVLPSNHNLSHSALRWIPLCCALSAFGAAILAWKSRYSMNPDGVSYLDMASEALRGGPYNLVNGCWGALYPSLIAVLFYFFRPSPAAEFPLVHFLNWVLFVLATLSFGFFLHQWLVRMQDTAPESAEGAKQNIFVPFAFCVFFLFNTQANKLSLVTPDLCVAGIVFLCAGIVCGLASPFAGWKRFVALGCILGAGYYAKPAMFPIALLLLLILFCFPPSTQPARHWILLATLVFLVVSAPLIALVSKQVGHLSFSESGRTNYLSWVNNLSRLEMIRSGQAVHPPRILTEKPFTLEFASPIGVTYPLHYDPTYWIEGQRPRFDFRQQLLALATNLRVCAGLFFTSGSLFAGAVVLPILGARRGAFFKLSQNTWWLVIWPLAVCAMLSLVHVEDRYIAPFAVLVWVVIYGTVMGRVDAPITRAVLMTVACSVLISLAPQLILSGGGFLHHLGGHERPDHLVVAETLSKYGVSSGDRLAVVGSGVRAHYARLAGVRIIAEISGQEFWQLGADDLKAVEGKLTGIGVKALVAENKPEEFNYGRWHEVPGTKFAFITLPKP